MRRGGCSQIAPAHGTTDFNSSSNSFAGTHWNYPRQVSGEIQLPVPLSKIPLCRSKAVLFYAGSRKLATAR